MRARLALATAVAVGLTLGTAAQAAPPKNFEKTVAFTDATPDPTGNLAATEAEHCLGELPREKPIELKVPGSGTVEVTISGFQGDWTLMITDAKGELITGADVNPPDTETASFPMKKAGTVNILPCNLAGTPQASVKMVYTFKKKK